MILAHPRDAVSALGQVNVKRKQVGPAGSHRNQQGAVGVTPFQAAPGCSVMLKCSAIHDFFYGSVDHVRSKDRLANRAGVLKEQMAAVSLPLNLPQKDSGRQMFPLLCAEVVDE